MEKPSDARKSREGAEGEAPGSIHLRARLNYSSRFDEKKKSFDFTIRQNVILDVLIYLPMKIREGARAKKCSRRAFTRSLSLVSIFMVRCDPMGHEGYTLRG
jgi:hypothetical protein